MNAHIPDPSHYGISPKLGFLSSEAPLTRFENSYYSPWDAIVTQLPDLIKSGALDAAVGSLPLLETKALSADIEWQRAYVVLAFTIHSYVWQKYPPNEKVPPQLAEPYLKVCEHLGMQPVVSYAGLCTWNWKLIDGDDMDLHNLKTLASFTGSRSEAAFYHVPVLIEYTGGHLMHLLFEAVRASLANDAGVVVEALRETQESLIRMAGQLSKLYATLDADFFYRTLRPFMAGGRGMEEKGLPRGMVFQRSNGKELDLKLVGGSAVQSALFPFLDYVLGVQHEDEVFMEMRQYMPRSQREFLEAVSKGPSLREFAESNSSNVALQETYDSCVRELRSWRGKHIAVVSKYIVQPAREAEKVAVVEKIETEGPRETEQEWELQGTGGSALIPFLRQARDETTGIASNRF